MKRELNMRCHFNGDKNKNEAVKIGEKDKSTPVQSRIDTDPLGMWTGVPTENPFDKPVQDADDL